MDGERCARRWAKGDSTAAHDYEEIQLVEVPGLGWRVRRVGARAGTTAHVVEADALAAVRRQMGDGWREVPASRSPEIRWGVRGESAAPPSA